MSLRRPVPLLMWSLLCALATPCTRAQAEVLHGELTASRRGRPVEIAEAVVWVERIPERTEQQLARGPRLWFWQRWLGFKPPAPLPPPHVIEIGRRFLPRVTAAPARSPIVFHNRDQVWHGIFSVTPAHRFELGKRAPGRVDTLRAGGAGIVQIRCDIHPGMTGWLVLTPNRAFTRPDARGRWALPELPPGPYVLRAWHPERGMLRREVKLARGDDTPVLLRW